MSRKKKIFYKFVSLFQREAEKNSSYSILVFKIKKYFKKSIPTTTKRQGLWRYSNSWVQNSRFRAKSTFRKFVDHRERERNEKKNVWCFVKNCKHNENIPSSVWCACRVSLRCPRKRNKAKPCMAITSISHSAISVGRDHRFALCVCLRLPGCWCIMIWI